MEKTFEFFSMPENFITDKGLPYNGGEFWKLAKELRFKYRLVTLLHPKANGAMVIFNRMLGKTILAVVEEGKDPRFEVRQRVLNYRNTPNAAT